MTALLPPSATPAEIAVAMAAARIGDVPTPLASLWSVCDCPAELLPWLAWAVSVDDWDPDWDDATRRAVIAASIEVHRRKGTIGSIRRALEAAGYGEVAIVEGTHQPRIGDNAPLGSDWRLHDGTDHWADYWVDVNAPIYARQVEILASILRAVEPAHARLRGIRMTNVRYEIGDGLWDIGSDIAIGSAYELEG